MRKPLDLPPAVARAFVKDMRAYFAEDDGHRRDAIAVRQLHALRNHIRSLKEETEKTGLSREPAASEPLTLSRASAAKKQ
jgi:hypothetical protein